jgi:hypothetical protein
MLRYRSLIHVGIVELDGWLPRQPSNKYHHHGGAVRCYSSMAVANQSLVPPGASSKGVGRGRCARVLFNYADRLRKKLINKLNNLFYFFTPYPTYNAPKMMASRFPHASRSLHIPSMLPSIENAYFWLVVVFWSADWRPINATMYCIFIIFASLHSTTQTTGRCPPTGSPTIAPPLQHPTCCCRRL